MSRLRVVTAEFAHETNTFSPQRTTRRDFKERREYLDEEVTRLRGTNSVLGGVLSVENDEELDLETPVAAAAMPGGRVEDETFAYYADRILSAIRNTGSVDGVLLALHGAMVTESDLDGEGRLLREVREEVGQDVPIVATYDLHGNVSDEMVNTADATVAYETYPHIDTASTGEWATRLLLQTIRGNISPTTGIARPPVVPHAPQQTTTEGPMAETMAEARAMESRTDVLKVNVFPGFYQADVPDMGFSVVVVTDGDPERAASLARELATSIWTHRTEFVVDYPPPGEAVREAVAYNRSSEAESGPVVLADLGDNPGGGGAADGTTLLRELVDQGVTNAGVAILRDPEAIDFCVEAGVGNRVTVTLGGKTDDLHGDPIEDVDGYVSAITDGEFINRGPMDTGTETHLGRTVRFECGTNDGVTVILTERRVQPLDAEIWRHVGIQPERLDVLVVKSTNHYRADYEPMASKVIPVDSPGLVAVDPNRFDYDHVRRPKYPIDSMTDDAYPSED